MKTLAIALIAVTLAGCSTSRTIVDQTQFIVVEPPSTLYNCPSVGIPSELDDFTNYQLAELIEKFYRANRTCAINMQQIRDYVQLSKESIENVNI